MRLLPPPREALAFSFSGVSTTRRPWKSSALAAAAPLFSAPAIGCAGTKRAILLPSALRAAAMTSRLVLPPSVINAFDSASDSEDRRKLGDRRRDQNQVGVARGAGRVRRDRVDDAALERELQVGGVAPHADHFRDFLCLLQREGERAADQPHAYDGKLHSFKLAASAARNLSFSSAVPMVTRRCSGRP